MIIIIIGVNPISGINNESNVEEKNLSASLMKNYPSTFSLTYECDIIVDDEGEGNFDSIQDAIDHAIEGNIICVYSGTYNENINVKTSVTLIGYDIEYETGDDIGKPVIMGNGIKSVVEISSDDVILNGFEIINSGNDDEAGILIKSNSNNNQISNNNINTNNAYGIFVDDSSNNEIINNDFSLNKYGGIILFSDCSNCVIRNNNFLNNGLCIYPVSNDNVLTYWDSLIIEDNFVNDKSLYFMKNNNSDIVSLDVGQLILANCNSMLISNLEINQTDIGIQLWCCSDIVISNNDIYLNNMEGVYFISSSNNEVSNNYICDNFAGIHMCYGSSNNIIHDNEICQNKKDFLVDYVEWQTGIFIREESIDNTIYKNNFSDNGLPVGGHNAVDRIIGGNNWNDTEDKIGNFWDDYTGIDSDDDGIGDTPYEIYPYQDENKDYHPIWHPTDSTPPEVNIIRPRANSLYIGDNLIDIYLKGRTLIIGSITVEVEAFDPESGINRVRFYLDEKIDPDKTDYLFPYDWECNLKRFGICTFKVVAYNKYDFNSTDEIEVIKIL